MKKNYSKPIVLVETFTPNQFVAACTPEINEQYVVNLKALVQGIHVKYDKGQDGIYDSNDHAGGVFTSDHSIKDGESLYYVGMGWGVASQSGQISWPSPTKDRAGMAAEGVGWFYLFAKTPGEPSGSVHVYGGDKIEQIVKNQS